MTNSEKIIELSTEELDQISGGIYYYDTKELIKGFIACLICLIGTGGGSVLGASLGAVEGMLWSVEAIQKNKDIGYCGAFWRNCLSVIGGGSMGFLAGTSLSHIIIRKLAEKWDGKK